MKRLLRTILLYAALGAFLAQVVAGALMFFRWEAFNDRRQAGKVSLREITIASDEHEVHVFVGSIPVGGMHEFSVSDLPRDMLGPALGPVNAWITWMIPRGAIREVAASDSEPIAVVFRGAGWPCLSAFHYYHYPEISFGPPDGLPLGVGQVRGGISVPTEDERKDIAARLAVGEFGGTFFLLFPRAIPYLPAWPGLLVNTVFYGLLLWAATHPRVIWRLLTRRKGMCQSCGYDVAAGGLAVCPECGKEFPESVGTTSASSQNLRVGRGLL